MIKLSNILLVDDDEITNFIDSDLITSLEITEYVSIAQGGKEACEYIEKAYHFASEGIANEDYIIPDIIFLDMNMPEIDGCGFLERANSIINPQLPHLPMIIMLSTSFLKDEIERAFTLSTFVKGYFEKPLDKEIVMNIYNRCLKERT